MGQDGHAVDLAVQGDGQLVESQDAARDHVAGQAQLQPAAYVGRFETLVRGVDGHDCRRSRGGGEGKDRGGDDARDGAEGRLHLAELDPVAVDLDLVVPAAQEDQLAPAVPAAEVAGPEHPDAGMRGELAEPPRAGRFVIGVATGHAGAEHVDLAGDAGRRVVPVRGEHQHAEALGGPADRDGGQLGEGRSGAGEGGRLDGGLGGPVQVAEGAHAQSVRQPGQEPRRDLVAAQQADADFFGGSGGQPFGHHGEQGGNTVDDVHAQASRRRPELRGRERLG